MEGYFELRALGPTQVKGLSASINLYEVVGVGPLRSHFELAARRGLTKFVGREHELAQMKRALRLVEAGHGQVLAVMGEPGAGKSRLVYEFKAILPGRCRVLETYSVSHGKAWAWLPVLELLKGYLDIGDADDEARRREKVEHKIWALDPALEDTSPYLLSLLGVAEAAKQLAMMDAQIKRGRTLEAIKRIILRESLNQPLVVIFEDLHWIDEETQGLLNLLVESIANARTLLLINYRPDYRHEWGSKSYYFQLRLDPLVQENADEMLAALLGSSAEQYR